MFKYAATFNVDSIKYFDTSNVRYMEHMFAYATAFSKSLCGLDAKFKPNLQHPRDYNFMFGGTNCPNMESQLFYPGDPNDPEDVGGVTPMCDTCANLSFQSFNDGDELRAAVDSVIEAGIWKAWSEPAYTYGYPMNTWDVSKVTDFSWVFAHVNFNDDISDWDVSSATDMVG